VNALASFCPAGSILESIYEWLAREIGKWDEQNGQDNRTDLA